MHLFRGSFILYLSFDIIYILKLSVYMLLELIFESSKYLVYLVDSNLLISLLCVSRIKEKILLEILLMDCVMPQNFKFWNVTKIH
jgi:hypothetical protein